VKRKKFTLLYDKFTQYNMYQILSQSVGFCRLYIKKHFGVYVSVHSVEQEVRRPSAEGATVEPIEKVRFGEGVSPSSIGRGLGRGCVPSLEFF